MCSLIRLNLGFVIIEMVVDADGDAANYRILEVNAAFIEHTGLTDALSRTARSSSRASNPSAPEKFCPPSAHAPCSPERRLY